MRPLIVLTASRGGGKTYFCRALFERLKKASLSPFSIIEENQRDAEGIPISLSLRDQGSGESIALATRGKGPSLPGKPYPPFIFSREAFLWAETKVKSAVGQGCGPVIIDEIGPLEVLEKGGFWGTIEWILENGASPLLVTIRPDLEGSFLARLPSSGRDGPALRFEIRAEVFDRTLTTVSELVFRHCRERKGIIYYEER